MRRQPLGRGYAPSDQATTAQQVGTMAVRNHRNILLAMSWYRPPVHRGIVQFARDHAWHITADLDDPVPANWQGDGVVTHLGHGRISGKSFRISVFPSSI